MWKTTGGVDDYLLNGIEFTYSSDCCGGANIVHMYGSRTGSVFSVSITYKVTAVSFRYGSFSLRDIWFTLADGSIAKTVGCVACNNGTTITLTATQSLVGLAFKAFLTTTSNNIDARD